MAEPIPLNAPDWHVHRLFEQIERLIDEQLRSGNITVAAGIGIMEMIKLKLYDQQMGHH